MDETLRHLRRFAESGVDTVVFTPHLLVPRLDEPGLDGELARHRTRFDEVLDAMGDDASLPRVHLGQEILAPSAEAIERVVEREDVGLAGGSPLLVEFGFEPGFDGTSVILRVLAEGRTPVVAHAERYRYGHLDPLETVTRWKERGAVIQVNGGSLAGLHRGRSEELARRMLAEGLIDLIASDHHGDYRDHAPSMIRETVDTVGEPGLSRRLWGRAPRAVLDEALARERAAAA
jgi:protein-tyrosine phosphatase